MTGPEIIGLAAAAAAVIWAVDVAISPRAPCRACKGGGRHWLSRAKAYGYCPVCKNKGQRLRFGARWVRPGLKKEKR